MSGFSQTLSATQITAAGGELLVHKGAASGYAGLDAGALVAAATLGTGASATKYLRGDQTFQPIAGAAASGCRVYNTADQSINAAANLTLAFDTSPVNQGGWRTGTSSQIIVPAAAAGYVELEVYLGILRGTVAGDVFIRPKLNGATIIDFLAPRSVAAAYEDSGFSLLLAVAAADVITINVTNGDSTAITVAGNASLTANPVVSCTFVGT